MGEKGVRAGMQSNGYTKVCGYWSLEAATSVAPRYLISIARLTFQKSRRAIVSGISVSVFFFFIFPPHSTNIPLLYLATLFTPAPKAVYRTKTLHCPYWGSKGDTCITSLRIFQLHVLHTRSLFKRAWCSLISTRKKGATENVCIRPSKRPRHRKCS